MCDNESRDFAPLDGIHDRTELLALEIQAAANIQYEKACGKAMQILENGLSDTLAFMAFPREHWSRISSTNPIERINREIRRRTRVVGVFPSAVAVD